MIDVTQLADKVAHHFPNLPDDVLTAVVVVVVEELDEAGALHVTDAGGLHVTGGRDV